MADSAELRQMVLTFRVSELQVLLGFAGRSKSGRKQELMSRALALVEKGSSLSVQIKIKDLYRSVRYPSQGTSTANTTSIHSSDLTTQRSDYYSSISNTIPVHPDVKLTKLPFYDQLAELLKPTSLVQAPNNRFQESSFTFHLTPQQAQDISLSRVDRHGMGGAKYEHEVQIQLRFILLETSCEQADTFPPSICVRVNSKLATLPNPIQSNKPGVEPRRPSRPVDITMLCRLSPTLPNHIDVSWASEYSRSYCMAVYLVRKLSPDDLLHRLRQNGHRHADHSRALIKERLAPNPDSEIAMTSIRVSLMCPLGKMMMRVPCRASVCHHLQCFDADTYLRMNEKKPTWVCPICDEKTSYSHLTIDGLFVGILRQAKDFTDVKFTASGEWQPVYENNDAVELFASPAPINISSVKRQLDNLDSLDTEPEPKKMNLDVSVIDLTEDSDEDSDATISSPYSVNPSSNDDVINIDTPPHVASPNPPTLTYNPPVTTTDTTVTNNNPFMDAISNLKNLPVSLPLPAHQQRPSTITSYNNYLSSDTSLDRLPTTAPPLPHLMPSISQGSDRYYNAYMMRPGNTASEAFNYYGMNSFLDDGPSST